MRFWIERNLSFVRIEFGAAILVGLVYGVVLVYSRRLPLDWAAIVILTILAPAVVVMVKDIGKLILILLVIDIPLGLDIAIANQPGHTGGPAGYIVSLMTIALIIGYIRWLIINPREKDFFFFNGIGIPALFFLFTILVSVFQATEQWFSFTQLFLTLQFVLMYIYIINHVKSWLDIKLVVTTLAICLFLESLLIILQYFGDIDLSILNFLPTSGGSVRLSGTFSGPNLAATFLAASISIIFAGYLTDNRLVDKKIALVSIVAGMLALVVTQSRAGWLVVSIAIGLISFHSLRKKVKTKTILMVFIALLILIIGFSSIIIVRLSSDDNNSAMSRIWYSQLAFNIIEDYMFTGVGANNQHYFVNNIDYIPADMVGITRTEIHNTYLAIWVELGIFGFLIFIWLLFAGCWYAYSAYRNANNKFTSITMLGFLGALSVFVIHMTVATFTGRRLQFLWLILGLITAGWHLVNTNREIGDGSSNSDLLEERQSNNAY